MQCILFSKFIYSYNKLISVSYNTDTILGVEDTTVNKMARLHFHWAYIIVKGDRQLKKILKEEIPNMKKYVREWLLVVGGIK